MVEKRRLHSGDRMGAMKAIAPIVLVLVFSRCNLDPVEPSPPVPETSCEAAEMQLDALGCDDLMVVPGPDEVIGTEDDMLWVEYCEIIQESGIVVLNTDCVVDAADCEEAEQCLN